jgi:hypothetical protein
MGLVALGNVLNPGLGKMSHRENLAKFINRVTTVMFI